MDGYRALRSKRKQTQTQAAPTGSALNVAGALVPGWLAGWLAFEQHMLLGAPRRLAAPARRSRCLAARGRNSNVIHLTQFAGPATVCLQLDRSRVSGVRQS